METIDLINGLNDAIVTINATKRTLPVGGSLYIWQQLEHAQGHLNTQIKELMQPTPSEALNGDLRAAVAAQEAN